MRMETLVWNTKLKVKFVLYRLLQNKSEINVYYKEGQDFFLATEKISIFNFTDFLGKIPLLFWLFTYSLYLHKMTLFEITKLLRMLFALY